MNLDCIQFCTFLIKLKGVDEISLQIIKLLHADINA